MDVQYPEMRLVVIEGLRTLADLQRRTPGSGADEAEFFDIIDDLDHLIGTPDARSGVGVIFMSEAEARAAENDGLNWPHCDGLNWPHLRPIVA